MADNKSKKFQFGGGLSTTGLRYPQSKAPIRTKNYDPRRTKAIMGNIPTIPNLVRRRGELLTEEEVTATEYKGDWNPDWDKDSTKKEWWETPEALAIGKKKEVPKASARVNTSKAGSSESLSFAGDPYTYYPDGKGGYNIKGKSGKLIPVSKEAVDTIKSRVSQGLAIKPVNTVSKKKEEVVTISKEEDKNPNGETKVQGSSNKGIDKKVSGEDMSYMEEIAEAASEVDIEEKDRLSKYYEDVLDGKIDVPGRVKRKLGRLMSRGDYTGASDLVDFEDKDIRSKLDIYGTIPKGSEESPLSEEYRNLYGDPDKSASRLKFAESVQKSNPRLSRQIHRWLRRGKQDKISNAIYDQMMWDYEKRLEGGDKQNKDIASNRYGGNLSKYKNGGDLDMDKNTYISKYRKYQEGGEMMGAEAGVEQEGSPEEMLAQLAMQAVENNDCEAAMQVSQAILEMMGGGGAPEAGAQAFRRGGKMKISLKGGEVSYGSRSNNDTNPKKKTYKVAKKKK
jgi:hypothetical protein